MSYQYDSESEEDEIFVGKSNRVSLSARKLSPLLPTNQVLLDVTNNSKWRLEDTTQSCIAKFLETDSPLRKKVQFSKFSQEVQITTPHSNDVHPNIPTHQHGQPPLPITQPWYPMSANLDRISTSSSTANTDSTTITRRSSWKKPASVQSQGSDDGKENRAPLPTANYDTLKRKREDDVAEAVDSAKEAKLDSAKAIAQDFGVEVNAKTTHPFFSRFCITIGNGSACPPPMASLKTSKRKDKGLCKKDGCDKKSSHMANSKGYCNDHRERLLCSQEGCSDFAFVPQRKAPKPKEPICLNHLDRSKRLFCAEKNCENLAQASDLRCNSHTVVWTVTAKVSKKCAVEDCNLVAAHSDGKCGNHTNVFSTCNEENCNEIGKFGGYCRPHLLRQECQYDGCENIARKLASYCKDHLPKCSVDGCDTTAARGDYCFKHTDRSKKRTCNVDGCDTLANSKGGYCMAHSNRCEQPCCSVFGDRSGLRGSYIHPENGSRMCKFAAMIFVSGVADKNFAEAEKYCSILGLKNLPKIRQEHCVMHYLLKNCPKLREYEDAVFDGSLSKFTDKRKQLTDKRPDFFTIHRSQLNKNKVYAIHIEYDETVSHEQDFERLQELHSQIDMAGSVFVIRICGQHNKDSKTLFKTKQLENFKEYELTDRGHAVLDKVMKYVEEILALILADKSPTSLNFIRKFNY